MYTLLLEALKIHPVQIVVGVVSLAAMVRGFALICRSEYQKGTGVVLAAFGFLMFVGTAWSCVII